MQGEGQTDVLITDFEKAFDKVGYRRLIHRQEFQKAQYWVLASSRCTYSPVHVKDLAESLSTKVRLLADDTILYLAIHDQSMNDSVSLQEDLRWLLFFSMETLHNPSHMSNTLDQIPVDKTTSPTESSRKMKPEVQ